MKSSLSPAALDALASVQSPIFEIVRANMNKTVKVDAAVGPDIPSYVDAAVGPDKPSYVDAAVGPDIPSYVDSAVGLYLANSNQSGSIAVESAPSSR